MRQKKRFAIVIITQTLLLLGWVVYNSKAKVTHVVEKERNRTEQNRAEQSVC